MPAIHRMTIGVLGAIKCTCGYRCTTQDPDDEVARHIALATAWSKVNPYNPTRVMLHVPMGELPGAIRESTRTVLSAHGYRIVNENGHDLTAEGTDAILRELGNNVAQSITSLDTNPENL